MKLHDTRFQIYADMVVFGFVGIHDTILVYPAQPNRVGAVPSAKQLKILLVSLAPTRKSE